MKKLKWVAGFASLRTAEPVKKDATPEQEDSSEATLMTGDYHDLATLFCQLSHIIYKHLTAQEALAMRSAHRAWREVFTPRITALRYQPDTNICLEHLLTMVFTKVISLSLSMAHLEHLPVAPTTLTQLKKLDLSNNNLPPEELTSLSILTGLQDLNISHNNITQLPAPLHALTSVRKLNLSGNQLTSLPPSYSNLTCLNWLHLGHNQLEALPPVITQLPSLQTLLLFHNQMVDLPDDITSLTSLQLLNTFSNALVNLPATLSALTSLTKLDVSRNQLAHLPPTLCTLPSLAELHLHYNKLQHLPEAIGALSSLRKLDASNNDLITTIPATICSLTSLTALNLFHNRLEVIPAAIGNLTNLKMLSLGGNHLRSVPDSIGHLCALTELDLSSNKLSHLPRCLLDCSHSAMYNRRGSTLPMRSFQDMHAMNSMPDRASSSNVNRLTSLKKLDLSGNASSLAVRFGWIREQYASQVGRVDVGPRYGPCAIIGEECAHAMEREAALRFGD